MSKFAEAAKRAVEYQINSPIMEDKEKISIEQIIASHPDGITVTGFDIIGEKKSFPVLSFAEEPDKYFYGGTVLTDICLEWIVEYDGDIQAASDALSAEGGVKVRLSRKKMVSDGIEKEITIVKILE